MITFEPQALEALTRRLHLATVRRMYPELIRQAEQETWPYGVLLERLLSEEVSHRTQTRIERFTAKARFPFMATIEELLLSAEYILNEGNDAVVLCERGIRTFERATRNTLDISAVPLLKQATSLPVIVDLSHALGRKDIMLPCARAALAAGSDGLMVEVHNAPDQALSDGMQQMTLAEFSELARALGLGHSAGAPKGTA